MLTRVIKPVRRKVERAFVNIQLQNAVQPIMGHLLRPVQGLFALGSDCLALLYDVSTLSGQAMFMLKVLKGCHSDLCDEAKRTCSGNERIRSKSVEAKLAAEVQALYEELSRVERRYTSDRRRMKKAYEEKIDVLERQLLQQSDDIESAKAAVASFMDQNRSFAASDSEIQSCSEARARGWYGWAKDNAHRNFSLVQGLPPEHAAELHTQCEEFARIENNQLPPRLLKHKISRVPYLLLHGLLANFICNEVFASPLWIVGACGFNDETDPTVVQQSIAELYTAEC